MNYKGRNIDVVSLWGQYVDFPPLHGEVPTYLPKVQCPNPSHDTFKRHFQINTRKPFVHCFAECGISGSYEHALALITGCTEKEARKVILQHGRLAVGEDKLPLETKLGLRKSVHADSEMATDQKALEAGEYLFLPKQARAYLDKRNIDAPGRGKWQIGWDEAQERIVIPAFTHDHRFGFLIRRSIDSRSSFKYLYTGGAIKTSLLFGACFADRDALRSQGLVLCEGPLDAIRLHQMGIRTAVAILGTGLSHKQARLIDMLNPTKVTMFFDRDSAGAHNIQVACERIHKVPMRICLYPGDRTDPASMTESEVLRSIDRALTVGEFRKRIRRVHSTKGRTTNGKRFEASSRS